VYKEKWGGGCIRGVEEEIYERGGGGVSKSIKFKN